MSSSDPVVIVSTARTPIGGMLGELTAMAGHQLGAAAVRAAAGKRSVAAATPLAPSDDADTLPETRRFRRRTAAGQPRDSWLLAPKLIAVR